MGCLISAIAIIVFITASALLEIDAGANPFVQVIFAGVVIWTVLWCLQVVNEKPSTAGAKHTEPPDKQLDPAGIVVAILLCLLLWVMYAGRAAYLRDPTNPKWEEYDDRPIGKTRGGDTY